MVSSFLPLLLGGEIGYRNRKGKRRWEHGWEIEGPFEQAFTFLFFLGVVVCGIGVNCCCCEGCSCQCQQYLPSALTIISRNELCRLSTPGASSGSSQELIQFYFCVNLVLLSRYSGELKTQKHLSAIPTGLMQIILFRVQQ